MLKLIPKFDPRLAAQLATQKRSIYLGLVCVFLTSLLTGLSIPLMDRAVRAIQNATPSQVSDIVSFSGERELAEALKVSREQLRRVVNPLLDPVRALPPAEEVARGLGKPVAEVEAAYQALEATGVKAETDDTRESRQNAALWELGMLCGAVIGLYGLKYFLTRGQVFYLSRASSRLASNLRQELFNKIQRVPVSYFTDKRTGAVQSVLNNDVGVYQGAVNLIRDSIDGPAKALIALIMIFVISWPLALVAMLFIPPMAMFINRNGRKMRSAQKDVQDDLAEMSALSQEALIGSRVIKAFSAQDKMGELYGDLVEKQLSSQIYAIRRFAQLRPMVELLGAASLAIILLICGFMAKEGLLQISQIVALTFALDTINQGAKSIANVNNTYNQVQAAAERIYSEVLDVPEEDLGKGQGRRLESLDGRIEFRGVSFAYPDGTAALKNVSFVIEPGTSLALVGPSGAGKSTIADLMLRFYDPTEGQILLDGVDYRELNIEWLRGQFGVVPQQTFLFAGSIAENLRLGQADASQERIHAAAAAANALVFIEKTEDGFETVLGERGARLSGGEGQRLAIARALVRDPRILLLDEATSALDAHSEKVVTEALEKAMISRTTLFIAHRLTTAARATQILMLRHGEVLEQGSHEELVAASGPYAAMYKTFAAGLLSEV